MSNIKKLTKDYKEQVLAFAYKREIENLFLIGSFDLYNDTFESNQIWGYYENEELQGVATHFKRWNNFVINAETPKITKELTDYGIDNGVEIKCIAVFQKYSSIMMERLRDHHSKVPKKISHQTVYTLSEEDFNDFSDGTEEMGTENDIDELVWITTGKQGSSITEVDRKRIIPHQEFILKKDNKIVSKANIHGVSKNYFQVGGVGTRKEYRKKGYAKQAVSYLCKTHFEQGIKTGLLFTDNENIPAQKVYEGIGFKPVDKLMIIEY